MANCKTCLTHHQNQLLNTSHKIDKTPSVQIWLYKESLFPRILMNPTFLSSRRPWKSVAISFIMSWNRHSGSWWLVSRTKHSTLTLGKRIWKTNGWRIQDLLVVDFPHVSLVWKMGRKKRSTHPPEKTIQSSTVATSIESIPDRSMVRAFCASGRFSVTMWIAPSASVLWESCDMAAVRPWVELKLQSYNGTKVPGVVRQKHAKIVFFMGHLGTLVVVSKLKFSHCLPQTCSLPLTLPAHNTNNTSSAPSNFTFGWWSLHLCIVSVVQRHNSSNLPCTASGPGSGRTVWSVSPMARTAEMDTATVRVELLRPVGSTERVGGKSMARCSWHHRIF